VFCNFVLSLFLGCGIVVLFLVIIAIILGNHHLCVFLFITLVYRITCPPIRCPIHLYVCHNSYSCSCLSTYSTFLFILMFSSFFLCILLFKLSHPSIQSISLTLTFSLHSHLSSYSSFFRLVFPPSLCKCGRRRQGLLQVASSFKLSLYFFPSLVFFCLCCLIEFLYLFQFCKFCLCWWYDFFCCICFEY
jgi:hypothetical protein